MKQFFSGIFSGILHNRFCFPATKRIREEIHMLFRKETEKRCKLCEHAINIDESDMLCKKYGVVSCNYSCKKFEYDPLKRIPKKAAMPNSDQYDTKAFSIVSDKDSKKNAT